MKIYDVLEETFPFLAFAGVVYNGEPVSQGPAASPGGVVEAGGKPTVNWGFAGQSADAGVGSVGDVRVGKGNPTALSLTPRWVQPVKDRELVGRVSRRIAAWVESLWSVRLGT
jgi:hypothetical protein